MKFLIAGIGSIGRRHFRNLSALGERDILLYRTYRSTLSNDELSGFTVETDFQKALAHKPDAVIVSNPTALHLEVAIPAAKAGCHLFLEKPISNSSERVDELRSAVRHSTGQVLVGFQFRFHPGLQKIRELIVEDAIGRPLSARAQWGEYLPDWHPWEDYRQGYSARSDLGGGVILTLCHPLDYLRWLLGEISELWAFTGRLSDLDLDVEDTAVIGLRFTNGAVGSVQLDYYRRPSSHNLEIVGTHGTIRWDNSDGAVKLYQAGEDRLTYVPSGWKTFPTPMNFERNDMFLSEMRHFLEVVYGEAQPICTLEDGIQALQLASAAHLSAIQRQIVQIGKVKH